MAVIATDKTRLSHLLKQEYAAELAYCRSVLVANDSAQTYEIGTVLGKVTATGKWKVCVQNAADGSQNPAAIVMESKAIPATTDTKVLALTRGPATISKAGLVVHSTWDTQPELDAMYAAFETLGIQVLDAV